MNRLRVGDVVVINGREVVVYAKVWHWCCGIQARVAFCDRPWYGGMVIGVEHRGEVVRRDLDLAATVCQRLEWSCLTDRRKARLQRNKDLHAERAQQWQRRWVWLRKIAGRQEVAA